MTSLEPSRFLDVESDVPLPLVEMGGRPKTAHIFDRADIDVVNAAIATGRPLLLRGEPGIGKSQLARAVAQYTGRAFVSTVVDARTEAGDLLYRYDAVRRLAVAQLQATKAHADESALDEKNFIAPGPLWWAFEWGTALEQRATLGAKKPWAPPRFDAAKNGVVVLIDEIDKADPSVPNGLLEALGSRRFSVPGYGRDIELGASAPPPLVVITSNEERTLPGAFLRRCWVREITAGDDIAEWLVPRGRAHFEDTEQLSDEVLRRAAAQLAEDRKKLRASHLSAPGQAEYLDLLGALVSLAPREQGEGESLEDAQLRLLDRIGRYVFDKHPKARTSS